MVNLPPNVVGDHFGNILSNFHKVRIMLRKILFAVVFLSPIVCIAQCKYTRNDSDPFTKQRRLTTKEEILWKNPMGGNTLSFVGLVERDSSFLRMRYSCKEDAFSVQKGSKLQFLLNDGKTVELSATSWEVADFASTQSMGTIWYIYVDYHLDVESSTLLKAGLLTHVRFYTNDGYIEKEILEKKQSTIGSLVGCL